MGHANDKLVEAINGGNGDLQEEMMDRILEGFDKVNNSKEEVNSKSVKGKKVKNKKVGKKAVLGKRAKGIGRGR